MKKLLIILVILFWPSMTLGGFGVDTVASPASVDTVSSPASVDMVTPSTSCDTSNDVFWWRAEAADFSGTNGTSDYSAGDDTGVLQSSAAIDTDAVKLGTNGLDIPTGYDYITFTPPVATLDDEGRAGFWLYINTFVDAASVLELYYVNGDNRLSIRLDGSTELSMRWKDSATARTTLTTTTANLSTGTWYFVEFAWKTGSGNYYREIFVNGVSKGSSSSQIESFATNPNYLIFGNTHSNAADFYIDNPIISTDSTVNLYLCKDETSWPG